MKIFVVGSGKLANAILSSNIAFANCEIVPWEKKTQFFDEKSIIIHAGSGRQLADCIAFCEQTNSVFVELSTGLFTETLNPNFTLIICPNTSLLLLKTLNIFKLFGKAFEKDTITITESHQASKKSVAGTAHSFADSLNFPTEQIQSIRDPKIQSDELGIPPDFLDKHAYHKIVISDGLDEISIETKVLGHQSYATGVKKIVDAVLNNSLEKKKYSVLDLIDMNLL